MSADIDGRRREGCCCCCCWAMAAAAAAWAACDGGGGVLRCCLNWLTFTTGPLLCGNCSGRGRECVRSNRPHLLQSYTRRREFSDTPWTTERDAETTYHFAGREARPPPGGGVGRAAVIAFSADAVGELRRRVVRVDDVARLARVCLSGDDGRADGARREVLWRRNRVATLGVFVPGHRTVGLIRVRRSLAHGRGLCRVRVVRCRGLRNLLEIAASVGGNEITCAGRGREE